MLIDYHLHNHFSPDSNTDTKKLIEKLRNQGVYHICITNHGEWFNKEEEEVGTFEYAEVCNRFKTIKKELDEIRPEYPDMDIRFGLELQYQPEQMEDIKKFVSSQPFDFILGSVHILDGVIISGGKNAHLVYEKMNEETAYTKYFEDMLTWVNTGLFDVVGHFDIIKKTAYEFYGPFKPEKYKPVILKILQAMKEKGIGIELNTGCMYKKCKELFPHPDILKWCVEIGIEHYTLGSDAHELDEVGRHLDEALGIAKEVGIKSLSTYNNRVATNHNI